MAGSREDPFLTPDGVAKIARLARIEGTGSDLALWAAQMEKVVAHVRRINEIPEELLPPADPPAATPQRPDESRPGGGREELVRNAAELRHGHVPVPLVIDPQA
jgi:aspartyl/glutamyl-tRNA(Asn/Gln) amidotransferase C subunit